MYEGTFMNIFKRLLFPIFLALSLGSTSFECMAQDNTQPSIDQLKEQMKTFQGRLKTYYRCLRKKCSKEERSVVTKAAIKDGLLTIGWLGAIGWLGKEIITMNPKYQFKQRQKLSDVLRPLAITRNLTPKKFFDTLGLTTLLNNNRLYPDNFTITFDEERKTITATLKGQSIYFRTAKLPTGAGTGIDVIEGKYTTYFTFDLTD